ncbi:hypothetical protein HOD29_05505 [archaeon]|mgnify:CR=1 FL=1|jgi:hypothetical protein|nr:hypothetical protein [archaeon]
MIKHIILNLEGTLIPISGESILRSGVEEFLEKFKNKDIDIISRMPTDYAQDILKELEIPYKKICGRERMAVVVDYRKELEEKGENGMRKVIGRKIPPKYFNLSPIMGFFTNRERHTLNNSVIISNHPEDIYLARARHMEKYQDVGYGIQVPTFYDSEDNFSFDKMKLDAFSVGLNKFLHGKIRELK